MENSDGELTPTQALGVAISCAFGDVEMHECQRIAISMTGHLKAMGYQIVSVDDPNSPKGTL